jgi:hypothetical protein
MQSLGVMPDASASGAINHNVIVLWEVERPPQAVVLVSSV